MWIDEKNFTARIQSGINGQELERQVRTSHSLTHALKFLMETLIFSLKKKVSVRDMSPTRWK